MRGSQMSGRDLQRARKSAARQKEDAYVTLKFRAAELEAALRKIADHRAMDSWDAVLMRNIAKAVFETD